MLAELADVLARDKFHVKSSQVNRFLANIENNSKVVEDNPRFKVISEASDDDIFINAAYTGKADYILTGDKHLLALKKFKQTKIVNVTQMLEILG
jgi:putative PIN family toxin of toxin-antitoxin system